MKTLVAILLASIGLNLLTAVLAADKVKIFLREGSVYNLTGPESMPESARSFVWIASAPESTRILIRVVDFMLRSVNDTLTIGTGSDFRDTSTTLTSFVGRFPRHSVLLPSDMGWLRIDSAAISNPENRMHLELTALQPHQDIVITDNGPVEISSPGYPLEYPNYADFLWTIRVPAGNSSLIRFVDVDLEYYYDKILIGTGLEVADDASWLTRISESFNGTELPTDVIVADRYIWIRFKSDRSKTYGGFQISVIPRPSLYNFDFYMESSDQPFRLDIGDEINLVSPNYPSPYPHGQNTTWYFDPPTDHLLRIDVISCHLEPRHDSVRIGTGRQVHGNSSIRLTGTSTPRGYSQLFAVNESLWIQFLSDFSVSYQGFWLRISAEREIVQDGVDSDRPSGINDGGSVNPSEVGHDKGQIFVPLTCAVVASFLLLMVSCAVSTVYYMKREQRRRVIGENEYTMTDTYTVPAPARPNTGYLTIDQSQTHTGANPSSDNGYITVLGDTPTTASDTKDVDVMHEYASSITVDCDSDGFDRYEDEPGAAGMKHVYMTTIGKKITVSDNAYHEYAPMSAAASVQCEGQDFHNSIACDRGDYEIPSGHLGDTGKYANLPCEVVEPLHNNNCDSPLAKALGQRMGGKGPLATQDLQSAEDVYYVPMSTGGPNDDTIYENGFGLPDYSPKHQRWGKHQNSRGHKKAQKPVPMPKPGKQSRKQMAFVNSTYS